ncbi:MAG: hypothetical protein A3I09_01060 [Deltaproteobacteria bacterium RIFCSPLOWO2_02_FULL_47_10]|nr:MAG: hypothetical protein A3I09_01060 [Deltaproteobacteria bacterium RIFCSPLOWO2_02_FULL_47_10]
MVPRKIRSVVQKFKAALRKAGFPPIRMFIYGSYARGENRPDSDIDICLVSTFFKTSKEKYRKKAVLIAFEIDPRIQVVLAKPKDIRSKGLSPLFSSIYSESIAA